MSKHKKTRQEKIIADLRRQLIQTETKPPSFAIPSRSLEFRNKNIIDSSIKIAPPQTTPYLFSDLVRTSLVTGAIIAGEIALFFLLKKQILNLPNLKF